MSNKGVYNADGKLVKLWKYTTLEDGYLSYTVTGADYVQSGYKVKAFLFDSKKQHYGKIRSAVFTKYRSLLYHPEFLF